MIMMMVLVLANVKCSTGLTIYDIFLKAADFDQGIVRFQAHAEYSWYWAQEVKQHQSIWQIQEDLFGLNSFLICQIYKVYKQVQSMSIMRRDQISQFYCLTESAMSLDKKPTQYPNIRTVCPLNPSSRAD